MSINRTSVDFSIHLGDSPTSTTSTSTTTHPSSLISIDKKIEVITSQARNFIQERWPKESQDFCNPKVCNWKVFVYPGSGTQMSVHIDQNKMITMSVNLRLLEEMYSRSNNKTDSMTKEKIDMHWAALFVKWFSMDKHAVQSHHVPIPRYLQVYKLALSVFTAYLLLDFFRTVVVCRSDFSIKPLMVWIIMLIGFKILSAQHKSRQRELMIKSLYAQDKLMERGVGSALTVTYLAFCICAIGPSNNCAIKKDQVHQLENRIKRAMALDNRDIFQPQVQNAQRTAVISSTVSAPIASTTAAQKPRIHRISVKRCTTSL